MDFDINAYLRLNPMDMIMVCVSTLIIIAIAKHFFWDKVLAYLDARKAAIQADIDAGTQSREAGEQYKRQYEEQMAMPAARLMKYWKVPKPMPYRKNVKFWLPQEVKPKRSRKKHGRISSVKRYRLVQK